MSYSIHTIGGKIIDLEDFIKEVLAKQPPTRATDERASVNMTEKQIKHMVDRFLGWKLPESFNPDCGISFKRTHSEQSSWGPQKYEPIGTNLLDAEQATAMVRYMIEEIPPAALSQPSGRDAGLEEAEAWQIFTDAFNRASEEHHHKRPTVARRAGVQAIIRALKSTPAKEPTR